MRPDKNSVSIDKKIIIILNQLFEIERKTRGSDEYNKISRNLERIKDALALDNQGAELFYEDPTGDKYSDTRNDLEAHIVGDETENLVVIDVIKPIIRYGNRQLGLTQVIQRGVVSVESQNKTKEEK